MNVRTAKMILKLDGGIWEFADRDDYIVYILNILGKDRKGNIYARCSSFQKDLHSFAWIGILNFKNKTVTSSFAAPKEIEMECDKLNIEYTKITSAIIKQ